MKLLLPSIVKQCGHPTHVGVCPACQRALLARQAALLAQASEVRV